MMATQYSEDEARRLLALAAEKVPPGIDLLAGFQARRRRWPRPRLRILAAGAVAAAAIAAITVILTAGQAPVPSRSAPAELTRAAMITAAQNYRVTSRVTPVQPKTDDSVPTVTGAFDPARGIGAEHIGGLDAARYDGRYVYLRILPAARKIYERQFHVALRPSQIWDRVTEPKPDRSQAGLEIALQTNSVQTVQQLSPPGLVALLKSARHVRDIGRASGPGWTGQRYSFELGVTMTPHSKTALTLTTRGTADVDQQGRIRRLTALGTAYAPHAPRVYATTVRSINVTFAGFGQPVPVRIPPASQVFIRPHP